VSGDGLVRKKLYTDSDLAVLAFRRCIILTSIDHGALRGDLGDRLLLADLERIPDERRRTEAEIEAACRAMRPKLLGALLSATARTLATLPAVRLATMPRMADFAKVLAALDTACPELTGGQALALFAGQRDRIAAEVVDSDAVAAAVIRLMESRLSWRGTAAELLVNMTPAEGRPPRHWPATARTMSGHLRRIMPALRGMGLEVVFTRQANRGRSRIITIEKRGDQPSTSSAPSEAGESDAPGGILDGRCVDATAGAIVQPSSDRPQQGGDSDAKTRVMDGVDGVDDPNPLISTRRVSL
jgi:hypothetical protein